VIRTSRLLLRPFVDQDLEFIVAMWADDSVMHFSDLGWQMARADAEGWFDSAIAHWDLHGFGNWAVTTLDQGIVGWTGLHTRPTMVEPEVVCFLMPEAQRAGLGTEACLASIAYGFHELGLAEIVCLVDSTNPASLALVSKYSLEAVGPRDVGRGLDPVPAYRIRPSDLEKIRVDSVPFQVEHENAESNG
jgi:ribosomal-protein-alanine N-acetyltransferase